MPSIFNRNIYRGFYLATIFVICIGGLVIYFTDHNIAKLQEKIEDLQDTNIRFSRLATLINQVTQDINLYEELNKSNPDHLSKNDIESIDFLNDRILSDLERIGRITNNPEPIANLVTYFSNTKKGEVKTDINHELMHMHFQSLLIDDSAEDYASLTEQTVYGRAYNFLILVPIILFVSIVFETKRREQHFKDQRRKAEEENEAKTQFLSMVTHELKTPMTTILAISNILKRSGLENTQLTDVDYIEKASKKQLEMIDKILKYSKLISGRSELDWVPMDLQEEMSNIQRSFQSTINQKQLKFSVNFDQNLNKKVIGDSVYFESLLTNIIGNALKFTESGGVFVDFFKGSQSTFERQELVIKVKDTGIGIAREKVKKLFEPFSQADASITRIYGGTGLGLSIAKKITQMLGGDIRVESKEGQGTCFTLNFFFGVQSTLTKIKEEA